MLIISLPQAYLQVHRRDQRQRLSLRADESLSSQTTLMGHAEALDPWEALLQVGLHCRSVLIPGNGYKSKRESDSGFELLFFAKIS